MYTSLKHTLEYLIGLHVPLLIAIKKYKAVVDECFLKASRFFLFYLNKGTVPSIAEPTKTFHHEPLSSAPWKPIQSI